MTSEQRTTSTEQFPAQLHLQRFAVQFEYPVYFTRQLFNRDNPLLAAVMDRLGEKRRHRAVVYVDAGVEKANPRLLGEIKEYFHARPGKIELSAQPMIVPGGEAAKTAWQSVRDAIWTLGNLHLDRQAYVIAVGGGGMLDMVGFAAALVHRGLRLIRVPTTVLAQNDAGVGVKNGMNEHGQKNFVGTFASPFAVLNDFELLATLPPQEWIGGAAEAFKVAIIADAAFFDFLCANASALRNRQAGPMEELIRRTAVLHLRHIATSGDPFELGSARPLDFGHWAAHKLELMSNYTLGHGQAVAIGIAVDSFYAMRQGLITRGELDRIVTGLRDCGLPLWCEQLSSRNADGQLTVLEGLTDFREHLGGSLCVTLPRGIGRRTEVHHINPDTVEEAVEFLKSFGAGA